RLWRYSKSPDPRPRKVEQEDCSDATQGRYCEVLLASSQDAEPLERIQFNASTENTRITAMDIRRMLGCRAFRFWFAPKSAPKSFRGEWVKKAEVITPASSVTWKVGATRLE